MNFPESKYLSFELDDHYEGKTERVVIVSKKHLNILGEIKWFGRWRQYAFFPDAATVWNSECMDDVNACIHILRDRRAAALNDEPYGECTSCHTKTTLHLLGTSCDVTQSGGIKCTGRILRVPR